jgi:hypothetical protein
MPKVRGACNMAAPHRAWHSLRLVLYRTLVPLLGHPPLGWTYFKHVSLISRTVAGLRAHQVLGEGKGVRCPGGWAGEQGLHRAREVGWRHGRALMRSTTG